MDMISRLPDEILCHILSFLQTHEAVATPLVSKRWRNLWISVPALDLDHFEFRRATRKGWVEESLDIPSFENFVNATILARDERQPITRFRLLYESTVSLEGSDLVHDWLNTVMPRRIENLEICIPPLSRGIGLKIYSCRTLVVLKLKGVPLGVYVSSHVELPSLKSLHLEKVHFVDFQSFLKLICGCPLLEDLEAGTVSYLDTSFDREFRFRSLPKLVSVVINDYNFRFPLKIISNAEFLSIEERTFGRVTRVFNRVVPEFPNLVHVVFTSSGSLSWHFVFEILKNCPKLQDFELIFSRDPDSMTLLPYPQFIPECLTSQFRNCTLKNYKGTRCELLFAQDIMQHSTSLRTMKICSWSSLSTEAKHEMLKQLALCPRRSALCELSFT